MRKLKIRQQYEIQLHCQDSLQLILKTTNIYQKIKGRLCARVVYEGGFTSKSIRPYATSEVERKRQDVPRSLRPVRQIWRAQSDENCEIQLCYLAVISIYIIQYVASQCTIYPNTVKQLLCTYTKYEEIFKESYFLFSFLPSSRSSKIYSEAIDTIQFI